MSATPALGPTVHQISKIYWDWYSFLPDHDVPPRIFENVWGTENTEDIAHCHIALFGDKKRMLQVPAAIRAGITCIYAGQDEELPHFSDMTKDCVGKVYQCPLMELPIAVRKHRTVTGKSSK